MTPTVLQYFHAPPENYTDSNLYITWAGHRVCDETHTIGPRIMDSCKLVFVVNGKGHVQLGNDHRHVLLEKGDMFIIFPRTRHHYFADPDDPWELMWVCFNGSHSLMMLSEVGLEPSAPIVRNIINASILRTLTTLINALGDTDDPLRLAATGELFILFSYLRQGLLLLKNQKSSETFRHDAAIWKAIRFIEENYHLDLNVETLCKHVNYSRSYLSRLFKQQTGMTIPEYTNTIRVEKAKDLLSQSNIPLREVATSVGIGDPFYFSKIFKSHTGVSPSTYRSGKTS